MSDYVEQNYTNRLQYPDYNLYTSGRAGDRGMNYTFTENSPWVLPLSTNRWSRGGMRPFPFAPNLHLICTSFWPTCCIRNANF